MQVLIGPFILFIIGVAVTVYPEESLDKFYSAIRTFAKFINISWIKSYIEWDINFKERFNNPLMTRIGGITCILIGLFSIYLFAVRMQIIEAKF